MKDTFQIIIRAGMKTFAGWLVAKAFADQTTADTITNGVGAGLLIIASLVWSHIHLFRVSNPLPSPKALGLLLCGLLLAGTAGCATALQSDKIITVKQRCFGIVVETVSTTTSSPDVKLGFCSTVWEMVPTGTNRLYAPDYMDTFAMSQSLNPFATDITENTGTGMVSIGTNGEAGVVFRPQSLLNTNAPTK